VSLTPETSVTAQKLLGADIIIPLDELPPYHIDRDALERSVYMSHRWEARSLQTHLADVREQAMYAVIHGGVDADLRRMSAEYLSSLPFDGFAIGGSLGKDTAELVAVLAFLMPLLPKDRPNHLLGIGDVGSILGSIPLGIDTFDSTFPTRNARHGQLLTRTRGGVQSLGRKGVRSRASGVGLRRELRVEAFVTVIWDYGSRVQGSGFRVHGSGFRVQGSGFRVQGSGFRFRVNNLRFMLQGVEIWVKGSGLRV